jgi:hypothetical protein
MDMQRTPRSFRKRTHFPACCKNRSPRWPLLSNMRRASAAPAHRLHDAVVLLFDPRAKQQTQRVGYTRRKGGCGRGRIREWDRYTGKPRPPQTVSLCRIPSTKRVYVIQPRFLQCRPFADQASFHGCTRVVEGALCSISVLLPYCSGAAAL